MPDKNWVNTAMPMGKFPLALLPPPPPEINPSRNKMHTAQPHKQTRAVLDLL